MKYLLGIAGFLAAIVGAGITLDSVMILPQVKTVLQEQAVLVRAVAGGIWVLVGTVAFTGSCILEAMEKHPKTAS